MCTYLCLVLCTHGHHMHAHTAELGDFDPHKHYRGYVSEFHLVPKQTEALEEKITQLHRTLMGKSNNESEYLFLAYARR